MMVPVPEETVIEIRLFGPMEVRVGGSMLPRLNSRRGLWLIAYLALRGGRPVERSRLDDAARAQEVVQKSAFLEFQITDKTQALEKVMPRFDEIARANGLALSNGAKLGGDTAKSVGVSSLLTQKSDSGKKDTTGKATADSAKNAAAKGLFSANVQPGQIPGQYVVSEAAFASIERALASPAIQAAMPPGKVSSVTSTG